MKKASAKHNRKVKILLARIVNKNLGDAVIADCARYLIRKALPKNSDEHYEIIDYAMHTRDIAQVKFADAVVFSGGGIIKFQREKCYEYVCEITAEAEKYGIPVFFNAVGVEGFDESDERCIRLKEALNLNCVKGISVRDDTETLCTGYIENQSVRVRSVFDPAVWCDKVYGGESFEKSDYVGLGIARDKLFTDYGTEEIDRDFLLGFWKGLALELEKRSIKWKIFTNGLESDEAFAQEVLEYIGHGEKADCPENSRELVKTIAGFRCVAACRMHSNIIAYSLGIPSVGFVWNDKLVHWGEKIGHPERFIEKDKMNPETVADAVMTAIKQGSGKLSYFKKRGNLAELRRFLKNVQSERVQKPVKIDFKNRLCATALGSVSLKHKNTNTAEALKESVEAGFRVFEADLRLTSDNETVCANGWTKDTFGKLKIPFSDELKKGPAYEEFLGMKYYGRYKTLSFDMLCGLLSEAFPDGKFRLVLDVGLPKKDWTEKMFGDIVNALTGHGLGAQNVIIRLQRERDVEIFKRLGFPAEIAYFLPETEEGEERSKKLSEVISFCKENRIRLLSMNPQVFTEEAARQLDCAGIEALVLSCTDTAQILSYFERGAYMVGSHFVGPDVLKRLTSV